MRISFVLSLLLVLLLIGGTSCDPFDGEGGKTVVEGQTVDRFSGQAIPDAEIQLYKQGCGFSSGYFKEGNLHKADGNGNFSFAFDAEKGVSYLLMGYAEKGY